MGPKRIGEIGELIMVELHDGMSIEDFGKIVDGCSSRVNVRHIGSVSFLFPSGHKFNHAEIGKMLHEIDFAILGVIMLNRDTLVIHGSSPRFEEYKQGKLEVHHDGIPEYCLARNKTGKVIVLTEKTQERWGHIKSLPDTIYAVFSAAQELGCKGINNATTLIEALDIMEMSADAIIANEQAKMGL